METSVGAGELRMEISAQFQNLSPFFGIQYNIFIGLKCFGYTKSDFYCVGFFIKLFITTSGISGGGILF